MKTALPLLSIGLVMTACVHNEELTEVTDLYTAKQGTALSYSMQGTFKAEETSAIRSIPNEAFAQVSIRIQNRGAGTVLGNRRDAKHPRPRNRTVGASAQ